MAVAPASAEDTCFGVAPEDGAATRGITWSGTVVGIRKTGISEFGDEYWAITFAVDRVYAHDPTRDFPKGAVLAAGEPFVLPNSTCMGNGALGVKLGGRYLVSAAFVSDQGAALNGIAIWAITGETAAIVPGLYGTAHPPAEIARVRTVDEALSLLEIEAPIATVPPLEPPLTSLGDSTVPFGPLAALLAILGLGVGVVLRHRRRVTFGDAD
jgi:hypothetical protein